MNVYVVFGGQTGEARMWTLCDEGEQLFANVCESPEVARYEQLEDDGQGSNEYLVRTRR